MSAKDVESVEIFHYFEMQCNFGSKKMLGSKKNFQAGLFIVNKFIQKYIHISSTTPVSYS